MGTNRLYYGFIHILLQHEEKVGFKIIEMLKRRLCLNEEPGFYWKISLYGHKLTELVHISLPGINSLRRRHSVTVQSFYNGSCPF